MADARTTFLSGLLDDAGLFPPASLPLADAVARHARDRRNRPWLLGRFLCRGDQLDELVGVLPGPDRWRVGVVSAARGAAWRESLAAEAAAGRRLAEAADVDDVELRLPAGQAVAAAVELVTRELGVASSVFFEIPWDSDVEDAVAVVAAAGPTAGVKIRCGGVTADAFPEPGGVAAVIVACAEAGVRLKATAGLHHPVRRPDPTTGATMHGFLNVVGAAALLTAGAISPGEVTEVVGDDDATSFRLDRDTFGWRDREAGPDAIAVCRRDLFTGYGSCSIDEPYDDLVAMGVLP